MRSLIYLALLSTTVLLVADAHGAEPAPPATDAAPAATMAEPVKADKDALDSTRKPKSSSKSAGESSAEPKSEADSGSESKGETEPKAEPKAAPEPAAAPTPYERAVDSLTRNGGLGLRFESEIAAQDGPVQHASGVAQGSYYSVSVKTSPEPDATYDGSWLVQNGTFRKRSESGMVVTDDAPASIQLFLDSLPLLPSAEAGLEARRAPAGEVAGVACQPRAVKLSPPANERYAELSACVDETSARIVKLDARTTDGARFTVMLSQQDAPTPKPQSNGRDWTSEFPIAKPEDRAPKLKYKDCPELITLLPKGCEGFVPEPSEETEPAPKQRKD